MKKECGLVGVPIAIGTRASLGKLIKTTAIQNKIEVLNHR